MPQPNAMKIGRVRFVQLIGALSTEFELMQKQNDDMLQENRRLMQLLWTRAPVESPRTSPPASLGMREATDLTLSGIRETTDESLTRALTNGTTTTGGNGTTSEYDGPVVFECPPGMPSQRAPSKVRPQAMKDLGSIEAEVISEPGSERGDNQYKGGMTAVPSSLSTVVSAETLGRESDKMKGNNTDKSVCYSNSALGSSGSCDSQETRSTYAGQRSSVIQRLKESPTRMNVLLDTVPSVIILANALKIGLSQDIEPKHVIWAVLETFFISCFLAEALLKLRLWGCREYFCGRQKFWNWFDFACLSISLFDLCMTYIFQFMAMDGGSHVRMFKFLRLARLARLIRALHFKFFDELKTMVLGVFSGMKVLFWAIILLFFVIFFLGVFMNSMVGEDVAEFDTVPDSMLTIFRCYTDGCTDYLGRPLPARLFDYYGGIFFIGYILSFMLVTVGIFNLIMAIFIDNVVSAGVHRKLEEIGDKSEKVEDNLKSFFTKEVSKVHGFIDDVEGSAAHARFSELIRQEACITRRDFSSMLRTPTLLKLLDDADIETSVKSELFDVLDVDMGGELEMEELVNGLMSLRGPITKTDIVAVKLKVRYITKMIEDMWRGQGFGNHEDH
jgi:hypothetical protein